MLPKEKKRNKKQEEAQQTPRKSSPIIQLMAQPPKVSIFTFYFLQIINLTDETHETQKKNHMCVGVSLHMKIKIYYVLREIFLFKFYLFYFLYDMKIFIIS